MEYPDQSPLYESLLAAEQQGSVSSMDNEEMLARDLAMIEIQQRQERVENLRFDLLALPVEVIGQIFCYACTPIPDNEGWERRCYPLWLGAICRAWRQIAWSTSELWTTIVVRGTSQNQTELLQQWLHRAKGRELDIFLGNSFKSTLPPIPLLIQLLIKHCEQWNSIEFHIPHSWGDIFSGNAQPFSLPNLRTVSLHANYVLPYCRLPALDLTRAPRLRSLGFSRLAFEQSALDLVPGGRITHIALNSCRGLHLRDFFKTFTHLQGAKFTNTTAIISPRTVLHERISSLTIAFSRMMSTFSDDYPPYFHQLTLPGLKNLEVKVSGHLSYTRIFLQFLERSACFLTTLKLECSITQEHDLIDFLYAVTSLEELYITDSASATDDAHLESGVGSTFFEVLHPDESTPYLPNLVIFSYTGVLAVQAIDFLEPFIMRSRMRDGGQNVSGMEKVALLRKATIRADQYSDVAQFCIAEYSDPQYIWELVRMIEEGVLVLMNMDGSPWS